MPQTREGQHSLPHSPKSVWQPPSFRYMLIALISYLAVGIFTVVAITCMFSFFLLIRMLDDMLRNAIPARLRLMVGRRLAALAKLDWVNPLTRWSTHLSQLADWEKNQRASWYPYDQQFSHLDGQQLQSFIKAIIVLFSRICPK